MTKIEYQKIQEAFAHLTAKKTLYYKNYKAKEVETYIKAVDKCKETLDRKQRSNRTFNEEYQYLQDCLSCLMSKESLYDNGYIDGTNKASVYKQAVLACKSALHQIYTF